MTIRNQQSNHQYDVDANHFTSTIKLVIPPQIVKCLCMVWSMKVHLCQAPFCSLVSV